MSEAKKGWDLQVYCELARAKSSRNEYGESEIIILLYRFLLKTAVLFNKKARL